MKASRNRPCEVTEVERFMWSLYGRCNCTSLMSGVDLPSPIETNTMMETSKYTGAVKAVSGVL